MEEASKQIVKIASKLQDNGVNVNGSELVCHSIGEYFVLKALRERNIHEEKAKALAIVGNMTENKKSTSYRDAPTYTPSD